MYYVHYMCTWYRTPTSHSYPGEKRIHSARSDRIVFPALSESITRARGPPAIFRDASFSPAR